MNLRSCFVRLVSRNLCWLRSGVPIWDCLRATFVENSVCHSMYVYARACMLFKGKVKSFLLRGCNIFKFQKESVPVSRNFFRILIERVCPRLKHTATLHISQIKKVKPEMLSRLFLARMFFFLFWLLFPRSHGSEIVSSWLEEDWNANEFEEKTRCLLISLTADGVLWNVHGSGDWSVWDSEESCYSH